MSFAMFPEKVGFTKTWKWARPLAWDDHDLFFKNLFLSGLGNLITMSEWILWFSQTDQRLLFRIIVQLDGSWAEEREIDPSVKSNWGTTLPLINTWSQHLAPSSVTRWIFARGGESSHCCPSAPFSSPLTFEGAHPLPPSNGCAYYCAF